jgi:hypothetical protein
VGDNIRRTEKEVDILDREALLESSVGAFGNLSKPTREAMQARTGFRDKGLWLVAAAASHQVVSDLDGAKIHLERCKTCRNDGKEMRKIYEELRLFVIGRTTTLRCRTSPKSPGKGRLS